MIRYQANADYLQEKTSIDNLIFAIIPDASVRYHKLKVGECHVIPYPNPADVAAMKDDAGVSDLDMKIWAMPVQRPYNPNARRMAELIQEDYSKAGVDVEIVSYEWGEYLSRSKDLDRDGAVLLGWAGDNGDPDNFLAPLQGTGPLGHHRPFGCLPVDEQQIARLQGASAGRLYLLWCDRRIRTVAG